MPFPYLRPIFAALAVYLFPCLTIMAVAQEEEFNYAESQVPSYTLPDPLEGEGGRRIDAETWDRSRRGEILELFKQHVFGVVPPPPKDIQWEVYEQSQMALGGKATRKQVKLYLTGDESGPVLDLLMYLPNERTQPAPIFLGLNFRGNHTITDDPAVSLATGWVRSGTGVDKNLATEGARGSATGRWPIETIIDRGFAVATIHCGDIDPDFHDDFRNGVHALYPDLQQRGDNFATISAWAWGLSRAIDYFEHDDDVDQHRVAVIGHSRLGKTALWAGANDERFAMVVSNDSGCGGAALARRRFGETVKRINTSFPHWFCENHKQYNDNEDALPVDQHELIALIAPRLVYVASASEDRWADPRGEFLAAQQGSRVYELLGRKGIAADAAWTDPGEHLHTDDVGYHLREGKHNITDLDWKLYLDFAARRMN